MGTPYAAAGTYTVTLTVTGNNYGTGTQSQTISVAPVNAPPVAWYTSACGGLSCSFNASGSSGSRRDDRELRLELRRWDDRFWCDG